MLATALITLALMSVFASTMMVMAWGVSIKLVREGFSKYLSYRLVLLVSACLYAIGLALATGAPPPAAPSLRDAIIAFQIEHGLQPDGVWGRNTDNAYRAFLKNGY